MKFELNEQDKRKILLGLYLGILIFGISLIFLISIGLNNLLLNQETQYLIDESDKVGEIIACFLLSITIVITIIVYGCGMIVGEIYSLVFSKLIKSKNKKQKGDLVE